MDHKWYYEDHGRAKGPISTRDLVNKIQKGDMTLMDLVFKEGDPRWLPAESFSEITELIGNISLQESADWIVLKNVNVDGKNINEQIGPFNAQQILDLIDRGKIRFSDYVWRTGYEKWVPLGRVDEFEKPLKSSVDVDKSLYIKPRQSDLLQSEKKEAPLKRVTPVIVSANTVVDESKPIEAQGEDLVSEKLKSHARVVHRTEIIEKLTDFPEQKFPIFDEMPEVGSAKRSSEKPKVKELPPLPNTGAVLRESVQKILSAESVAEESHPVSQKSEASNQSNDSENKEKRERISGWWIQAGLVASFMFIIFSAGVFVILSKKRSRDSNGSNFSIKIAPPPAPIKNVQIPKPEPEMQISVAPKPTAPIAQIAAPKPQKSSKEGQKKNYDVTPTVSGGLKNKSYYHHKERIYLFYTSSEGERLASELQKASSKHQKSAKQWNAFYGGWKNKAKTYVSRVSTEARRARLHRSLFKQLMTKAGDLEDVGRDINTQMGDGRSVSKVASAKNLETQFKNIGDQARNLDR